MKIAVCIVTFNRLEFLKKIISSLRNQTYKIDQIIVTNNSSTDGTEEWLNEQNDIYVVKQDNIGSSGGQYTSIETAYNLGFDYIWIMDDDVVPEPNCLEELIKHKDPKKILVPARYEDGNLALNDVIKSNFVNPFTNLWIKNITKEISENNEAIQVVLVTFEGPFFHRSLVESGVMPDPGFFILADDTDWSLKSQKKAYEIYHISKAKLERLIPQSYDIVFSWKTSYYLRNLNLIDIKYGNFLVKYIRPFLRSLKWIFRYKSLLEPFKILIKSYQYSEKNEIKKYQKVLKIHPKSNT